MGHNQADFESLVRDLRLDADLPEANALGQAVAVRGPGRSSRKKWASCSSNDRSPFGMTLMDVLPESESSGSGSRGIGDIKRSVITTRGSVARGRSVSRRVPRKCDKSSAMSLAVLYRSVARLDRAFRQIRSSSLGIVSSICAADGVDPDDLVEHRGDESPSKRPPACQKLIEHHAEAEDIGAAVDSMCLASGLLGARVSGRAGVTRPPAEIPVAESEAKIGQIRLPAASIRMLAGLTSRWTRRR